MKDMQFILVVRLCCAIVICSVYTRFVSAQERPLNAVNSNSEERLRIMEDTLKKIEAQSAAAQAVPIKLKASKNGAATPKESRKTKTKPTEKVSIKIGSQFMAIDGDEGRFREDNYVTDDYTGGLEELLISGKHGDAVLDFDAHAVYDGDYGLNLNLLKKDSYFFKLNSQQTRHYYDGSNEPWDPSLYGLDPAVADRKDSHIYTDRFNTDMEWGLEFDNFPALTFGYTRWTRDGQETLLRGEDAARTGQVTTRSTVSLRSVDAASDKVFVQLAEQFAGKHNVSVKQEIEVYHEDQVTNAQRYTNGTLNQLRQYNDEPQFQESLTHVNYNSFLTEKTYLSTNYLFQDLKNRSNIAELRPISGGVVATGTTFNQFINTDINNERKASILNLGLVNSDSLAKNLRIGFNARFEKSDTESEGDGLRGGTVSRKASSDQSEYQYGESFSLSYNGIKRTSLSYILELEQRRLNWSELADIASYELVSNFGAGATSLDRETNILHNNIINTIQTSTRLNDKSRVTTKYKHAQKRRKYDNVRDNLPAFYPGYIGSTEQTIDQVTLGYNTNITKRWSGGLQYVLGVDEWKSAVQSEDGMQLSRNAISGSLTGTLTDKFILALTIMSELQNMETPGQGISTNPTFFQGEGAFDYTVERYVSFVSGNYRLSDKTSTNFGIQHTEVKGTLRNSFDKLWLGANHKYNDDTSVDTRLTVLNFNEKTPGGYNDYDDYHGLGAEVIYNKKF